MKSPSKKLYFAFVFPKFKKKDLKWIQSLRLKYDSKSYAVLLPHFTILGPFHRRLTRAQIEKIGKDMSQIKNFNFELQRAILMPPSGRHKSFYCFLTPRLGGSNLKKINGLLLLATARPKVNFLPHLTIGSFFKKEDAKNFVQKLNNRHLRIRGQVQKITLARILKNRMKIIEEITLGENENEIDSRANRKI